MLTTSNTSTKTRAACTVLATAAITALAATGCAAVTGAAAPTPTPRPVTEAAHTATSHLSCPTERANDASTGLKTSSVDFAPTRGVNVSYQFTGQYSVSAGQPWRGVTSTPSTPSAPAAVTVQAGHNPAVAPAQWFTGSLANRGKNADVVTTTGGAGQLPGALDYAFDGNLTINGTSYQIVTGYVLNVIDCTYFHQWSVGGTPTTPTPNGGTWTTTKTGALLTPDGKYEIVPNGANQHTFTVEAYHTQKPNNMDFTPANGLNVAFTYAHNHSVSSGQQWGGVSTVPSAQNQPATVTAYAETKDTTAPAQWFKNALAAPADVTTSASSAAPGDLYFAFDGDLTVNGNAYPVVIGEQGSSWWHFGQNYWLVGGAPVTAGGGSWSTVKVGGRTALVTPDHKYLIEVANNCHTFNVLPYQAA